MFESRIHKIHLVIGPLAYHSMTPVFDSQLSFKHSDAFFSRQMWIKTPGEILGIPKEKVEQRTLRD